MKRVLLMALGVSAILAATATPSLARESKGDIAGGWQYLHSFEDEGDDLNIPKGFFVEGAGNITPTFAVIGEYTGSFKNESETFTESGVTVTGEANLTIQTFMGGVRVGTPTGRAFRPFAQVLLGGVRSSIDGSVEVGGVTISDSESQTDFGFDFGGGVDFSAGGGVGVRTKASYLHVAGDTDANAFRLQVGVVIPF